MFLPGIGGHLKVSHRDPRVSFGNESTNLSVQKSFLPFYIKSTHTNDNAGDVNDSHEGNYSNI